MDETTADRLAIAATQLGMTTDRINVTAEDLAPITAYLTALTEHGYQITSLALRVVENTDPAHPIRDVPHGTSVQTALGHAQALFDAGIHFASDAEHHTRLMHPDDTP